jgi:hypothetical protein
MSSGILKCSSLPPPPLSTIIPEEKKNILTNVPSKSFPDEIHIQHKLFPEIQATFTKNKKIIFTQPPQLQGKVATSMFEASYVVRNRPCFAYSEWEIIPAGNGLTIYSYEKQVNELMAMNKNKPSTYKSKIYDEDIEMNNRNELSERSNTSIPNIIEQKPSAFSTTHNDGDVDITEPLQVNYPSPWTLVPDEWTSPIVAHWIDEMGQPELVLKEILYFRRYDTGMAFEFLCVWEHDSEDQPMTWLKYTDVMKSPIRAEYLKKNWDIKYERNNNWEEETNRDDDYDIGSDFDLPEIGTAYAIEKVTIDAAKIMEREEKKRKENKKNKRSQKRQRTSKNPGSLYSNQFHDSDEVEEVSDISGSEDSSEESSNSDEERLKPKKIPTNHEKIEWLDIFDLSSVVPTPRYAVKRFKKNV